ncbi:YjbH domain-containing protein [Bacteroides sp. 224]|uniref:YjbH domain-containing protein n=1 Tax=Bacteroides sp. 224 TaxID=2302936 RepID=UPI0013D054D1|nr:YjbH domain-containing protein [Bacteroides sp. 224]NDV66979.1 hypothetical protein [Bacteroides sp. 224]
MKRVFILIILVCGLNATYAQLAEKLHQLGFENIQVTENNRTYTVAFEDNVYRGTYRGIGKAIQAGMEGIQTGALEMVVLHNQIPQLCITLTEATITAYKQKEIGLSDVYRQMGITTATDEATNKLKQTTKINSSKWKTDIVFYPDVTLENFSFDKLYHYAVDLSPALQTSPWKGAMITAQVVFPILTNMNGEHTRIRPGVIALSQEIRFKKNWQGRVVAGNFTENRIGVQTELTYRTPNGRFEIGGLIGSTGYSEVNSKDGWYIGTNQRINAMLKGMLYMPQFNMEIKGEAGRYLYGDYGLRGDLVRHFGEYAVGVYGMFVEGEVNGGFHFSIPLAGKSWKRNRMIRVKPADYFAAEYSVESYGKYLDEKMGRTYHTRPDENRSARFYQPDYIRYFLIKEINK